VDDQERLQRAVQPGDVHSFVTAARGAPQVAERLVLHPFRRGTTDEPERLEFDVDPNGGWRVVLIEPISGSASMVKVYIRAF